MTHINKVNYPGESRAAIHVNNFWKNWVGKICVRLLQAATKTCMYNSQEVVICYWYHSIRNRFCHFWRVWRKHHWWAREQHAGFYVVLVHVEWSLGWCDASLSWRFACSFPDWTILRGRAVKTPTVTVRDQCPMYLQMLSRESFEPMLVEIRSHTSS